MSCKKIFLEKDSNVEAAQSSAFLQLDLEMEFSQMEINVHFEALISH